MALDRDTDDALNLSGEILTAANSAGNAAEKMYDGPAARAQRKFAELVGAAKEAKKQRQQTAMLMKQRGAENKHLDEAEEAVYNKDEAELVQKVKEHARVMEDMSSAFNGDNIFSTNRAYCTTLREMCERRNLRGVGEIMRKWER